MTRRMLLLLSLAVLTVVTQPALARRRAIAPGNPAHCVRGVIANDGAPFLMTTDATHLYWIDDESGSMHRVPLHGGAVEDLGVSFGGYQPWSMVVDDATIYIGVSAPFDPSFKGAILAMPKTGGPLATLIPDVLTPIDVEIDGGYLYWAAAGTLDFGTGSIGADGKIERARTNGTERQTLADHLSAPTNVELDDNFVWYGETGSADGDPTVGIYRVPMGGGTVETINTNVLAPALALTPDSVVVEGGTTQVDAGIFRVAKKGGAVTVLAENPDIYGSPTVFDGDVYFITISEEATALWTVPLDGSQPARQLRNDLFYATSEVIIDDCAITTGLENGDIERIAY